MYLTDEDVERIKRKAHKRGGANGEGRTPIPFREPDPKSEIACPSESKSNKLGPYSGGTETHLDSFAQPNHARNHDSLGVVEFFDALINHLPMLSWSEDALRHILTPHPQDWAAVELDELDMLWKAGLLAVFRDQGSSREPVISDRDWLEVDFRVKGGYRHKLTAWNFLLWLDGLPFQRPVVEFEKDASYGRADLIIRPFDVPVEFGNCPAFRPHRHFRHKEASAGNVASLGSLVFPPIIVCPYTHEEGSFEVFMICPTIAACRWLRESHDRLMERGFEQLHAATDGGAK
jgi:hypothetical protein